MAERDTKASSAKAASTVTTSAAPKPRARDTGTKAASWIRPPSGKMRGRIHVASFYFRTKDARIDAHDRALMIELADSYARYAEHHGRMSGDEIWGHVVGYADPRASAAPSNTRLSHLRADSVAVAVAAAFKASQIATGFRPLEREGAGVDPAAATVEDTGLEDVHAPFRRADLFLVGQTEAEDQPVPAKAEPVTQPPDYSDRPHDFERFEYAIRLGDKGTIVGLARRVRGDLDAGLGSDQWFRMASYRGAKPEPLKPPWWDNRKPGVVLGRGGRAIDPQLESPVADSPMARKAVVMARDYKEFTFYALRTDEKDFIEARRGGDEVRAAEAAKHLAYLVFMMNALRAESDAILALAGE